MTTRADPWRQRFPRLYGQFMVDTYRGILRVRKWPRKRGSPKSAEVGAQNDWFKAAVKLSKIAAPTQQSLAIDAAKGTGLYPRDLIMNAISGGMIEPVMPDGRVITFHKPTLEPVMFQGAILQQDTIQSLPAVTYTSLVFSLPEIDTAGFWSIAQPTRLTIPAFVEVVNVFAGWKAEDLVLDMINVPTIRRNGIFIARDPHDTVGFSGGEICCGPRVVEEGDWFDFQVRPNKAVDTTGDVQCFFALEVLQVAV